MTPTHTTAPEWYNENELRSYPLREDSESPLPASVIADLHVTVSSAVPPTAVYVSSAYVSHDLVSVAVSAVIGGRKTGLLARTVTRDELKPRTAYSMHPLDGRAAGYVAFGDISDGVEGSYRMDEDSGRIEESAITYTRPAAVTSLTDETHDAVATGVVSLAGGGVYSTRQDPEDPSTVIVTLEPGWREKVASKCSNTPSADTCGITPVTSINGVKPDESGTITLRFT